MKEAVARRRCKKPREEARGKLRNILDLPPGGGLKNLLDGPPCDGKMEQLPRKA
ncbi:MAG: hypothetical protein H5T73_07695 [Actinobacteria bacterium]|nr:hypothetical protein [Actinomycetota bacterium]